MQTNLSMNVYSQKKHEQAWIFPCSLTKLYCQFWQQTGTCTRRIVPEQTQENRLKCTSQYRNLCDAALPAIHCRRIFVWPKNKNINNYFEPYFAPVYHLFISWRESFLFFWNVHIDFCTNKGHTRGDKTNMSYSCLHDDSSNICTLCWITSCVYSF